MNTTSKPETFLLVGPRLAIALSIILFVTGFVTSDYFHTQRMIDLVLLFTVVIALLVNLRFEKSKGEVKE